MVKRGEIYYADLSPVVGSEQGGLRPVLIVQNDVETGIVQRSLQLPSPRQKIRHTYPPTSPCRRIAVDWHGDSIVLLEQIRTIDKRLFERPGWAALDRPSNASGGWSIANQFWTALNCFSTSIQRIGRTEAFSGCKKWHLSCRFLWTQKNSSCYGVSGRRAAETWVHRKIPERDGKRSANRAELF